eukprot:TRINITY_DN11238_c0_g2_i1.p1 TRINITY_DN11238_c0_g2~~TRINITY_DN11238_c0_g2_i1.p1  ORF type:complete len:302 (+),score=58.33 TRINITY_DN11238_c0_g2_i1:58-963(+)
MTSIAIVLTSALSGLLKETPMLMAHDAATGYLNTTIVTKAVYDWTITQVGRFPEQLDCGVRAFDLRPAVKNNKVIMHHGGVDVDYPLETALSEVIAWAGQHPGELVIPIIHHCSGDNCTAASAAVVSKLSIPVGNCSSLEHRTYEETVTEAKMANGGSVMAFFGCSASNYDSKITCYPPYEQPNTETTDKASYERGCYGRESDVTAAFGAFYRYMNKTAEAGFPANSFSQLQSIWQEDSETVEYGDLYGSSLIKDEVRSDLNNKVLQKLRDGWWPNISFFEVNNACHHGNEIAAFLKTRSK